MAGASLVDLAHAAITVKKNAIALRHFDKGFADADRARVASLEIFRFDFQPGRHGCDFGLVDPHIARRPGAAIAATGALELQSKVIPMAWFHDNFRFRHENIQDRRAAVLRNHQFLAFCTEQLGDFRHYSVGERQQFDGVDRGLVRALLHLDFAGAAFGSACLQGRAA